MTRAKQTAKKFDLTKVVLLLKSMSLGCTMVTSRSETLLYMSTPHSLVSVMTSGLKAEGRGGRGEVAEGDGVSGPSGAAGSDNGDDDNSVNVSVSKINRH